MQTLTTLDWAMIGLYFTAVLGVAAWATYRERRGKETSTDYFLAGRNAGWLVIGASLFASNIGAEHLVGLAGTGASSGVAVGHFEVEASLILLLLTWLFIPFYLRSGVFTMPEFLERRYSSSARWYLAVISIIGYVLTKISVNIAAGGIVFQSLGINFWTGAFIVVIATGVYTVLGGLRAVLYTDFVQMFVFVIGSTSVMFLGLREVGGWGAMTELAGDARLNMWRPATDPDFPWTGVIFGAPILGVWYWCTDQFIVQRVLSARGIDQAQRGAVFAGWLKVLPLFLFVLPGVLAYCLVRLGRIELPQDDQALPVLIQQLLPSGLRGVVVAGLLAAIMSSLSSVYNSCSTLVTWDIYRKLRPAASERQLVFVGQLATVAMVAAGIAWIPFMENVSDELYKYLQSVQAYISPPIAAVFLLGILWPRANSVGALTALLAGFLLGMGRLGLELNQDSLLPGSWLHAYTVMNFLHFAILLFAICTFLLVVVSIATRPEPESKLRGYTLAHPRAGNDELPESTAHHALQHRVNVGLSILLVGAVATIWIYFRGS